MKNISNISSTTPTPESAPRYSLKEDGFIKQLNDAISASNQVEINKQKAVHQKTSSAQEQLQASFNQMNTSGPTKYYSSASILNSYKAQKAGVKSKLAADL